jgi:hypothetical protein
MTAEQPSSEVRARRKGPRVFGLAVLVAVVLAIVATTSAQPPPQQRELLTVPTGSLLIGFAGNKVVVQDRAGLLAVGEGTAPKRVLRDAAIRGAAAVSDSLVAVVHSNVPQQALPGGLARAGEPLPLDPPRTGVRASDRTVLLAGAAGKLRPVVRCSGAAASVPEDKIAPVVDASAVAWEGCDGRSVVVEDGAHRENLPADGRVLAIAMAGGRLGWIATPGDRRPAVLHLVDLDHPGSEASKPVGAGFADTAALVVAPDGRIAASVMRTSPSGAAVCEQLPVSAGTTLAQNARVTPCSHIVGFPTSGELHTTAVDAALTDPTPSLVRVNADGTAHELVNANGYAPMFAISGDRIATLRPTCTHTELALEPDAPTQPAPLPTCPLTVSPDDLHADPAGRVSIHISCPAACVPSGVVIAAPGLTLIGKGSGRLAAGGATTLHVQLTADQRRLLRHRRHLTVMVYINGLDRAAHGGHRILHVH